MIDPNKDALQQLRNYIFASIISADNDEFELTEKQKQDIISRYGKFKGESNPNWEYIFEPIPDEGTRIALVDLFN